jgi:hypothetical protein
MIVAAILRERERNRRAIKPKQMFFFFPSEQSEVAQPIAKQLYRLERFEILAPKKKKLKKKVSFLIILKDFDRYE